MPPIPDRASLAQCSATRLPTGMYGTAEISQVLLNCVLAIVATPAAFARCQFAVARGPGPTAEIEYSPTSVLTPPRSIGRLHSLTLSRRTPEDSFGINSRHMSSGQPQSHTITSALRLRSEEHTSELQSRLHLVCRLLLEKKK